MQVDGMRKILLWLLAALFVAAAVGSALFMFFSHQGIKSVVASVIFVVIFLFLARHFAVLAIRWRPLLTPAERMQAAADMQAMTELPVIARPSQLKLRPGETCHFQAQAKYFPDGDRGNWMNKPVSYPGWFSITDQRITMSGQKAFTVPIEEVISIKPYRSWQGLILHARKGDLLLIMYDAYQTPRILELMGISPKQEVVPASEEVPAEEETQEGVISEEEMQE